MEKKKMKKMKLCSLLLIEYLGSSSLLLFIFWGALPKIEKNVKICLNTFSRNYLCQKIVKGGVVKLDFPRPPKFYQIWMFHKNYLQGPHFEGKVQVLYLFGNLWSATKRGWGEKSQKWPGKLILWVTKWQKMDTVTLVFLHWKIFWKKF